jgi:hypothetical protein
MEKLFVDYATAKQLKEKGFDEECMGYYNGENLQIIALVPLSSLNINNKNIDAPLYQQVIDWFREKHKIHITIDNWNGWCYTIEDVPFTKSLVDGTLNYPSSIYYEAMNAAITEALKLI